MLYFHEVVNGKKYLRIVEGEHTSVNYQHWLKNELIKKGMYPKGAVLALVDKEVAVNE